MVFELVNSHLKLVRATNSSHCVEIYPKHKSCQASRYNRVLAFWEKETQIWKSSHCFNVFKPGPVVLKESSAENCVQCSKTLRLVATCQSIETLNTKIACKDVRSENERIDAERKQAVLSST
uniref:Uncharacterized protein n=1 Tax=Noccaea caerulescens TaxID=107243 RepID=A0A1J3G3G5_NOCCA